MAGTIDNPVDLRQALVSGRVIPGDTLWLRAGTYTGDFVISVNGTEANRITFRAYPGEQPKIDGTLTIGRTIGDQGQYIDVRNLEVFWSNTNRGSVDRHFDGTYLRTNSVTNYAPYSRVINCIVHDGLCGIGDWSAAHDSLVYGNLLYNGGEMSDLRGHGHAHYCQNTSGIKTIKHNIMGPHFGRTGAYYGEGNIIGLRITDNIFVDRLKSYVLIGGTDRINDAQFFRNHLYSGLLGQYTGAQNGSILVQDNTVYNPGNAASFLVGYWEAPTVTGNKVCGKNDPDDVVIGESFRYTDPADTTGLVVVWNNNEYHYLGATQPPREPFKHNGIYKTFAQWQAAGMDADGTYTTDAPAWNSATFYANEYTDANDIRVGVAVIWNCAGADTVSLDLGGAVANGASVKARSYLDYFNDIQTLEVIAGAVTVNMQAANRTIAKPTGWAVALAENSYPIFGAFMVEKA